jgi:hypothetical protein
MAQRRLIETLLSDLSRFLEENVLADEGIVLHKLHLVGSVPLVLLGVIAIPALGRLESHTNKITFLRLGHCYSPVILSGAQ